MDALATSAAQSHLQGGDEYAGGEVYASCPHCKAEVIIDTEGHTEHEPYAVVSKVVSLR